MVRRSLKVIVMSEMMGERHMGTWCHLRQALPIPFPLPVTCQHELTVAAAIFLLSHSFRSSYQGPGACRVFFYALATPHCQPHVMCSRREDLQKTTKDTWRGNLGLPRNWLRGPTAVDKEMLSNPLPKEIAKGWGCFHYSITGWQNWPCYQGPPLTLAPCSSLFI